MGRDMAGVSPRLSHGDPLQLDPNWSCSVPLLAFEEALEQSVFRAGLTRADWLKRLAQQLHKPHYCRCSGSCPRDGSWRRRTYPSGCNPWAGSSNVNC